MTKFPKRSPGRRKEDQIANRIIHVCKLATLVLSACFLVYQAAKGMYVQEYLYWHSLNPIVKQK